MKKPILFLLLSLCYLSPTFSQFKYGFKVGLNYSNIAFTTNGNTSNLNLFTPTGESDYLISPHLGIFTTNYIGTRFSIEINMLYSREGYKFDVPATEGTGRLVMHYINFPIVAGFNFLPKLKVALGPDIGYLLSANQKTELGDVDATDFFSKDFKFGGILGITYTLTENLDLDARYVHGITRLNNSEEVIVTDGTGAALGVVQLKAKGQMFQLSLKYIL